MAGDLENSEIPQAKKPKIDEDTVSNDHSRQPDIHETIKDLSKFKLEKILHNNSKGKSVCLQGTFEHSEGVGIVFLEKTAFEESSLSQGSDYFSEESGLKKIFHNDIYGNYECYPKPELNCK